MALILKVTAGPLKGQKFTVRDGLGIGRSKGEIRLDDQKVSSLHAFVAEDEGRFILNDNGSKNGIRFNDERAMEISLKEGVIFQIGNSEFEVVKVASHEKAVVSRAARKTPATPKPKLPDQAEEGGVAEWTRTAAGAVTPEDPKFEAAVAPAPKLQPHVPKWNEVLALFTDQVLHEIQDQPKAVAALIPAVKLTFIGGLQAETEWILGYGPRRIGPQSVDLPIFEPGVPEICFEILPSPEGVTFRTNHPKDVTLNGQQLRVKPLTAGDIILVGTTRIEVELLP